MKELLHKIKIYLNEKTTVHAKKRYRTIVLILFFQVFVSSPIAAFIYFTSRDIIKPILNNKNVIIIN